MNIDIKLEKEIEKSLNSSSKQCLNTIHKNKTPSEKYMMVGDSFYFSYFYFLVKKLLISFH